MHTHKHLSQINTYKAWLLVLEDHKKYTHIQPPRPAQSMVTGLRRQEICTHTKHLSQLNTYKAWLLVLEDRKKYTHNHLSQLDPHKAWLLD